MNDMPRTEDGGLQHIVTGETNDGELWDDTLFMTVLFLAKMGRLLGRPAYVDEAVRQFRLHIRYLADPATGLWFHGWTFHGRHNFARALWARGNCWITAGTYEFLEIAQLDEPVRQELAAVVAAQVRTLARLQHPSGLWHTLLDDPASYLETSASAGFGAGILKGIRLGLLDAQYLDTGRRALAGVLAQTTPEGDVHNVSYGTGMGRDLDHYRNIPLCQMAYGQALALLLLGEALYLQDPA